MCLQRNSISKLSDETIYLIFQILPMKSETLKIITYWLEINELIISLKIVRFIAYNMV